MTKTEAKPVAEIVNELFFEESRRAAGTRPRGDAGDARKAEMTDALGAEKGERSSPPARLPLRLLLAHSHHSLVGKLELRVPQDRDGRFSTTIAIRAPSRRYPALRTGARGDFGRDVRAGRLDPEGQGDHPRNSAAIPSPGLRHFRDQQASGRKRSRPLPAAPPRRAALPTSSSTRATRRCARAAW